MGMAALSCRLPSWLQPVPDRLAAGDLDRRGAGVRGWRSQQPLADLGSAGQPDRAEHPTGQVDCSRGEEDRYESMPIAITGCQNVRPESCHRA
jgi:hypothetical protein